MHPEDIDGMANSVDPDQTAPEEQSDLGLHCLLRPICPNTYNFYGTNNNKGQLTYPLIGSTFISLILFGARSNTFLHWFPIHLMLH